MCISLNAEKVKSLGPFSTKLADKAENVRQKEAEKVSVSLRNMLKKVSVSLCKGLEEVSVSLRNRLLRRLTAYF